MRGFGLRSQSSSVRQNIQAAIFDMDGVLVDSHPLHRKAWRTFLRTLGRDASDVELDYILDGRRRDEILRHFLGPLSGKQIAEYGRHKDRIFRESAQEVRPIAGAPEFVRTLASRSILIAVATSASIGRTRLILDQLRLRQHLQAVVTGDDVPAGKPAPDIYQAVCRRIGIQPAAGVAFEDSVSGVQSAKAAGLHCVGVLTNQPEATLSAAGADLAIQSFLGVSIDQLEADLLEKARERNALRRSRESGGESRSITDGA